MIISEFEKELSKSNIGSAGMHDRYITIPKTQIDPEDFFGIPPMQVTIKDRCLNKEFLFHIKKKEMVNID
ncbi:MAG: hypothetical protein IPG78_11470 [Ignavibacteria bacterium]|nr:hypothetical protein [Ignavibacteria bacterium]